MKHAAPPPALVDPATLRVADELQPAAENPPNGTAGDHPSSSSPQCAGAKPIPHYTGTALRVIEPVVPADDEASISALARAYVRNWEDALARGTLPPPAPWGDSEGNLSPRGDGVRASRNERITGAPAAFVPTRRIMLVDDEAIITRTLQLALEQLGYTVAAFTLPEEALVRFQTAPDDFDLIITDYWMPKLNGLELAAKIRACRPAVGVMLFSGYSVRLTPSQLQQLGISTFLSKPIEIANLAGVLDGYFAKCK